MQLAIIEKMGANNQLEVELKREITKCLKSEHGFVLICSLDGKGWATHAFSGVCKEEVLEATYKMINDGINQGMLENHHHNQPLGVHLS